MSDEQRTSQVATSLQVQHSDGAGQVRLLEHRSWMPTTHPTPRQLSIATTTRIRMQSFHSGACTLEIQRAEHRRFPGSLEMNLVKPNAR